MTTNRWVVWSQDTFGHDHDRDPPRVESIHRDELGAKRSQVAVRRREANNGFFRTWVAQDTVASLLAHSAVSEALKADLSDSQG